MNRNDRKVAALAVTVGIAALAGLFILDGIAEHGTSETSETSKTSLNSRISGTSLTSETSGTRKTSKASPSRSYYAVPQAKVETFPFDPNVADSTELLRLGLRPWQVRNIYKYRAAGGIYRRKEDFAQLYGLTVKDYRRLAPYIRISRDYAPAADAVDNFTPVTRDTTRYPVKIDSTQHIELNTDDTLQLRKVPGIGRYYAREILRYGRWLGGYVSVDQLDEIEGFPQSAKRYFAISNPQPQKLNVNRLSLQQLRKHPYINYRQASAIVDYRRLHGDIHDLQELRFSKDFPPEAIRRLLPYVTY